MIYHITSRIQLLEQIDAKSSYTDQSLETESFIHCSTAKQIPGTLGLFFKNVPDLCLLHIDESHRGVATSLKYEDLGGEGQLFPHIYAEIPFAAVLHVESIPDDPKARSSFVPKVLTEEAQLVSLIELLARIPSFSSYEERLHPAVQSFAREKSLTLSPVADRNLLVRKKKDSAPIVYLAAHLDKINHFGEQAPKLLDFSEDGGKLRGLLDDAVGIAIALLLMAEYDQDEVGVLLSELEESTGLKQHPHLMRNQGDGLVHGQGARTLSHYLVEEQILPELIVTVDVTPKFKGDPGTALYSNHWEYHKKEPSDQYLLSASIVTKRVSNIAPACMHLNNTNDYLIYGEELQKHGVHSIALEPSIFPYHKADEEVFVSDLMEVLRISRVLIDVQLLSSR